MKLDKSHRCFDPLIAPPVARRQPIPRFRFHYIWTLAIAMATLTISSTAQGAFRTRSGNLTTYLKDICIPPGGTEIFEEPSAQDMVDWSDTITALLDHDYTMAANLADWLLYDLIRFTDSGSGCVYYVLVEQLCPATVGCFTGGFPSFEAEPCRGLGTYVFNPHSRRALNFQVPHAETDELTRPEGIAMFLELQATFLEITGTTRCANADSAGCGGPTTTCGGSGDYRESDAAHFTRNFFQVASTTVHDHLPDVVAISVHGFNACDSSRSTSFVQISNGTGCTSLDNNGIPKSAVRNSIATQLSIEYNALFSSLAEPYTGLGAGSCNLYPGEPVELTRIGCPAFCGGSNTQGREINGDDDACDGSICSADLPERFIHLEQQLPLRWPPPGLPAPYPPGMSWQITIDAVGATFPTLEMWVDFSYGGSELGTFCRPYNTLAESLNVANAGETLLIKSGVSSETPIIAAPVTLRAYNGSVVLGQ